MSLRKIIQTATTTLVLAFTLAVPIAVTHGGSVAYAAAPGQIQTGINSVTPTGTKNTDLAPILKNIANILLFIVGVASVILIIIGGLRYVLSAGDSNAISGAKNTILYAVVGLVVASMAFAIVNFVAGKV